jgi:O-antigen ligase
MTWIAETGLMGLVLLVAGAMAIVKKGWQKRRLWVEHRSDYFYARILR